MFRRNIQLPATYAATTNTASTSCGLTIPGESNNSICITRFDGGYSGAAQTVLQQMRLFDGSTEIHRFSSLVGGTFTFYYPIKITRGANLVATISVSVNTITGIVSVLYYREPR